jgi:hypothetical protein
MHVDGKHFSDYLQGRGAGQKTPPVPRGILNRSTADVRVTFVLRFGILLLPCIKARLPGITSANSVRFLISSLQNSRSRYAGRILKDKPEACRTVTGVKAKRHPRNGRHTTALSPFHFSLPIPAAVDYPFVIIHSAPRRDFGPGPGVLLGAHSRFRRAVLQSSVRPTIV